MSIISKFQNFIVAIFLLALAVLPIASLPVLAVGTVNVSHLASRLPVNSVSDGSISICFVNAATSSQTNLQNVARNLTTPISLDAGSYTYHITSFVRSSADGSLINPCTLIGQQQILLTGSMTVIDGQSYNLSFSGQGQNVEPRGRSSFQNQTPFSSQGATAGPLGPGLYVSYPDFLVDETGTRYNGPLYSSNSVCIDNGAAGGRITATNTTGTYLYFGAVIGSGIRISPPNIDGSCADIFFDSTLMPYVEVSGTYDPAGRLFVGFNEGGAFTGFSSNFSQIVTQSSSSTTNNTNFTTNNSTNSTATTRRSVNLVRTGGQEQLVKIIFAIALILFGVFLLDAFYSKAIQE